jgi:hypothetical protein
LIPAGVLTTVPVPVPLSPTVSCSAASRKVAVTAAFASRSTVQAPVPVQAPVHPLKTELAVGVAASVTLVPAGKDALHELPQLTPAGLLVIMPEPVPERLTLKAGCTAWLNVAATEVLLVNVTLQAPAPVQGPAQAAKTEFAVGAAVSVTAVPEAKVALQVGPQSMPVGLLLTVPVPGPLRLTLSCIEEGGGVTGAGGVVLVPPPQLLTKTA